VRRFWNRPLGSKVVFLLSIVFLLEMLAPWQRVCAITSGGDDPRVCGWTTAYAGSNWGRYAALLAIAILIWELLPIVIPRLGMRSWAPAIVTAILATALVVCTILELIIDNEFQTAWAWVGLAIALAILLTAYIRVRFRWERRGGREEAEPAQVAVPPKAEPPPAGGPSP
jgi:hypothetical protein